MKADAFALPEKYMAGNILTPQALWGNFKRDKEPSAETISEKKVGDVIVSHVFISGRNTQTGQVKIFATIARNVQLSIMPAVLIVQDLESRSGDDVVIELAKRGYMAVSIDIAGKREDGLNYTLYPEEIEYANYVNVNETLTEIEKGVKDSCWYEWGIAVRYAIGYLKNQPCISSIGAIGIKGGATLLWQVAGTDNSLSAFVAVMNAGWQAYKNQFKFKVAGTDTQMSENMFKYVAGVEPQSYATGVKCPTLMLVATNSNRYDADRAYDTVARIDDKIYSTLDYTPNAVSNVGISAIRNTILFLDEFLMRGLKTAENLPSNPEVKCAIKNGKIEIEVLADETELSELCAFVSEGVETPCLRAWRKISGKDKNEKGRRVFYYSPYPESGIVTFFVQARYDSGFTVCSPISAKKFKPEEVEIKYKERIVFSGREEDAVSIFGERSLVDESFSLKIDKNVGVKEKSGPMGISGAYAENGLITFKINAEKDKPVDDAMLMLDVYVKSDDELTVKLICDYFGKKTEYMCKVAVKGGKVWHNVQLDMNKFKTADGKIIKSYSQVNAIEFSLNGTYIINNVLWL